MVREYRGAQDEKETLVEAAAVAYDAVVIIEREIGHDFAADGQMPDVHVVDLREPDADMAADWCASELDKVADLPPSSNVRQAVERAIKELAETFGVDQTEIDDERR